MLCNKILPWAQRVALYVVIIQSLGTVRYIYLHFSDQANVFEAKEYYRQKCIAAKYFYSNIPMWLSSVQIWTYGNTHKLVYYNTS